MSPVSQFTYSRQVDTKIHLWNIIIYRFRFRSLDAGNNSKQEYHMQRAHLRVIIEI